MNKKTLLWCILSILLVGYITTITIISNDWAQRQLCAKVDIVVNDPANIKFVTVEDITREIGNEDNQYLTKKVSEINTYELEKKLNLIDKIERSNCVIYNNSVLRIDVEPMVPVARIFDNEKSYYINKEGKMMLADNRYLIDVPIIVGSFDSIYKATSMLPLVSFIKNDTIWNSLVSGVKVDKNHDIIIVPMIKGHVINFGDTSLMKNKFDRLRTIYKEIMPIKGWNYYDTISVKWRGQVVATKHNKRKTTITSTFADSIDEEEVSVETMNVTREVAQSKNDNNKMEDGVKQQTDKTENNKTN